MAVATLARKPSPALPNSSARKMLSVMAGVGERGTGLGKGDGSEGSHPSLNKETSLGDPDPRQKGTPEPGWSGGWGCTAARQHPGRKEAFPQSQGHGPGSDRRVSGHPHTMFEGSRFSMAFMGRHTVCTTKICHQGVLPLSLSTSTSEHGDLPASKL